MKKLSRLPCVFLSLCTGLVSAGILTGCSPGGTGDRVCFKEHCFNVETARSESERRQGLQHRYELGQNQGMLFIFPYDGRHSFWMKNTNIALDMIWLDYGQTIVHIEENALPCQVDYCSSYTPDQKARYVLEVPAGTTPRVGWARGDRLEFHLSEL